MDAKQIGEVIKKARKNKKITQLQLGKMLSVTKKAISDYELAKINVIPFEKRAKLSSVLNIPVSELLYDNDKMACISTNEAVDELRENRLVKAVNAELEEWLCSGDTDYLHKAMAVIRAEINNIKGVDRMTIKELYEYANANGFENLPFRYGYVDDDGVYRPRDFDFSDFEYDAEEVTMLFSEDALKALADEMLEEGVTMNYAGIEEGFEVYRCSHCQADVYHTIYWYDYCPGCGRKIKEWK